MEPNEAEITNPKLATDNSVILNAIGMLSTSAGFNKDEFKIVLDVIKNAKELPFIVHICERLFPKKIFQN